MDGQDVEPRAWVLSDLAGVRELLRDEIRAPIQRPQTTLRRGALPRNL